MRSSISHRAVLARAASAVALSLALGGPATAGPHGMMRPGMMPMEHHGGMMMPGGLMPGHGGYRAGGCGMMPMMHDQRREARGGGKRAEAARPRAQVTVVGEGEAGIAPDLATVSMGVMVQAPTAAEAMAQNATRQQAVIDAVRAAGIEARDIQTTGLGLTAVQDYSREGQPPVITGYQASNVVTVRVRELDGLGPLLDSVIGAGANEIQGISFSREDAAPAEGLARTRAVESARAKAEALASAAGMRLGRLVTLSEAPFGGEPRPMMRAMGGAEATAYAPVERGEIGVRAQVTAVWELAPAGRGAAPDGRRAPPQPVGPLEPEGDALSQPQPLPGDPAPGIAGERPPVVAPASPAPAPGPDGGAAAPAIPAPPIPGDAAVAPSVVPPAVSN